MELMGKCSLRRQLLRPITLQLTSLLQIQLLMSPPLQPPRQFQHLTRSLI